MIISCMEKSYLLFQMRILAVDSVCNLWLPAPKGAGFQNELRMKRLKKYFLIILISLGFFACGENLGEGDVYYYSMENKSGRPIVIKSYRSDFPDVTPEITSLAIDEKLEKVFKDGLPPSGYNFKVFLSGSSLYDSLVIIYGNDRMTIFEEGCNQNQRNPIDYCINSDDFTEDFVFTEDDYNNAMECGGPCD